MIWYLDTSAAAKLVRREAESSALRRWLRGKQWIGSDLLRTELRRAALRAGGGRASQRAERLLREIDLISFTPDLFDAAAELEPATLRSLDALHLSAARSLGDDLSGIVAYDKALAEAAQAVGLDVAAPGTTT